MIKNIIVTMEEKLLKLRDVDLRNKTRFVFLFFVNKSNRQRVVPGRQGAAQRDLIGITSDLCRTLRVADLPVYSTILCIYCKALGVIYNFLNKFVENNVYFELL